MEKLQECLVNEEDTNIDFENEEMFETFGLNYDCSGFPGVFDYAVTVVKGSLAAANALTNRQCQVRQ